MAYPASAKGFRPEYLKGISGRRMPRKPSPAAASRPGDKTAAPAPAGKTAAIEPAEEPKLETQAQAEAEDRDAAGHPNHRATKRPESGSQQPLPPWPGSARNSLRRSAATAPACAAARHLLALKP